VDASGGNVTYACLSLAENLDAEEIGVYGADFSYPQGQIYSRGAYIYPYFDTRQHRLSPKETLFSAFLYRSPLVKTPGNGPDGWYYETATLNRYRASLETKAAAMEIPVRPARGRGAPISIRQTGQKRSPRTLRIFAAGQERKSAAAFLEEYRNRITALPPLGKNIPACLAALTGEERAVFITLLPQAAAIKRRESGLGPAEIIGAARDYSIGQIDKIIRN
jgi:hypothetical protein